jgi:hypothetical protein
MSKKKVLAVKFGAVNKKQITGKVGHTRTGACTAPGRCTHGRPPRVR